MNIRTLKRRLKRERIEGRPRPKTLTPTIKSRPQKPPKNSFNSYLLVGTATIAVAALVAGCTAGTQPLNPGKKAKTDATTEDARPRIEPAPCLPVGTCIQIPIGRTDMWTGERTVRALDRSGQEYIVRGALRETEGALTYEYTFERVGDVSRGFPVGAVIEIPFVGEGEFRLTHQERQHITLSKEIVSGILGINEPSPPNNQLEHPLGYTIRLTNVVNGYTQDAKYAEFDIFNRRNGEKVNKDPVKVLLGQTLTYRTPCGENLRIEVSQLATGDKPGSNWAAVSLKHQTTTLQAGTGPTTDGVPWIALHPYFTYNQQAELQKVDFGIPPNARRSECPIGN